ncbi:hypothetical protein GGR58DRAFT_490274 [Xylaria digitata]|nr:hypothetical protein GGR58DRAFT_490274 [Xylaria digitata]
MSPKIASNSCRSMLFSFSFHLGVAETGRVKDIEFIDQLFARSLVMSEIISPERDIVDALWAFSAPQNQAKQSGFYEQVSILPSEDDTQGTVGNWHFNEILVDRIVVTLACC